MDEKAFEVDGIFLRRMSDNTLIMEYTVGGVLHTFKIEEKNAIEMMKALDKLYGYSKN